MEFNVKNSEEIKVNGYSVYIFDSFYKKPHLILQEILNISPSLHKQDANTYNNLKFLDLRHQSHTSELEPMINYFENFTEQNCTHKENNLKTNMQKWFKNSFNNYKENYWWPHYDDGYTLLVYLNDRNILNLYDNTSYYKTQCTFQEHQKPWHPKDNYNVVKQLKIPFNRAVLFPANMILHGCGLDDDYFFNNFRLNQAVFFKK